MKLNSKTRTIATVLVINCIICIAVGVLGYVFSNLYLSTSWKNDAMPYLTENEELISEIGIVQKVKYRGMHERAEEDGRPVYFEITTDRGEFFVVLWMDAIEINPNRFIVSKHLVTTEDKIMP